jgi:hypothetical protein
MSAGEGEEESYEVLAEQLHPPRGLRVKLDRGFQQGVYCIWIECEWLAERIGFVAARRKTLAYAERLYEQMDRMAGYSLDGIEDFSHSDDPRRKRNLENTFMSIALTSNDGLWHDAALERQFQLALLCADQEWDQHQAGVDARRHGRRQDVFRRRPDTLLESESYRHIDGTTKERLLAEVTALAFPPKGRGI